MGKTIFRAVIIFLVLSIILTGCASSNAYSLERFAQEGLPVEVKICEVKDDRAAIVTVISDDGFYKSGTNLYSLVKEIGIHVTVAGTVNNLSPHLEEWKQIEEDGFIEVISHSYSHLKINEETNPSYEDIYHEYIDAKEWFEQNFKTPAFCFVTPNNDTTDTGYQILQENGFLAVRQGQRGENSLSPDCGTEIGNWLNLMTRGIGDVDTTAERNVWVDTAIKNHSWLIEMWHDILPNDDVHYQSITGSMAREHLNYIAEKETHEEIWVAPFTQAVSYIYKRQNLLVNAWYLEDRILLQISRTREDLPWEEFNVPISIRVELPEGWGGVSSVENDCIVYECDDPRAILINTDITSGTLQFVRN